MQVVKNMKQFLGALRRQEKGDGLDAAFAVFGATLGAKVIRANGGVEDKGIICRKVVTTAFVNYLVQTFLNSTTSPLDVFKYHDAGTGTGAPATGDTAMQTAWGGAPAAFDPTTFDTSNFVNDALAYLVSRELARETGNG